MAENKILHFKRRIKTGMDKDTFFFLINEQHPFKITNKGSLLNDDELIETHRELGTIEQDEEVIHEFYIPTLSPFHTTDYVRLAFEELYPDKDFDGVFKTEQPGVFVRIRESEYSGIEQRASELKFEALEEALDNLGYKLVFEKP